VLGVDASPDGWVGVAPDPDRPRAYSASTLGELIARAEVDGPVQVVGVDIPVGLAERGWRSADLEARARLGPRRASLFLTPVRAALEAPAHATAVRLNRAATGQGCSRQAYGLRTKILEVDALVRAGEDRVLEVHPELTFTAMAARPPAHGKKTWAGQRERLGLLADQGLRLDELAGDPGRAAPDDVVDAAAVAWTARRRQAGTARPVPDPPERVAGRDRAIWA
jgi:predicted RNase H-like nuclease